jgi:hypothetical protein
VLRGIRASRIILLAVAEGMARLRRVAQASLRPLLPTHFGALLHYNQNRHTQNFSAIFIQAPKKEKTKCLITSSAP